MQQLILFIHMLVCFVLVTLVLMQQGKGANMGAAFGSGSSNTLFGSRGPASFMMKITAALVTIFFITSVGLGYIATKQEQSSNKISISAPAIQHKTVAPIKKPVSKIAKKTTDTTVPTLGTHSKK